MTILHYLILFSPLQITSLPCTYQIPRVEDVILDVNLEHGHDSQHARSKRALPTFEQLRIHLHYDDSVHKLPPDRQRYVNSSLLPEAVGYWEKVLKVPRTDTPIRLRRKCVSTHQYVRLESKSVSCVDGCRDETTCGEAVIPPEHLMECSYCTSHQDCHTSGKRGDGVLGADYLLYVTALPTKRCDSIDTLAYAAHCQQENVLDRPIAGHVNLCPHSLSTHDHDKEILVSTVKHEILHALGFSVALFAFFRDERGKPRTKRNKYGRPTSLNKEAGYYDWNKNTIDTVLREKWWTGDGMTTHAVRMMVTPRVREEARAHFGCSLLEGAELENQGGEGTALTHWEKRVFENEAMTGTHTQNPVYSRITLALLEDSGWYKANYEVAEELHWGQNLGCDFAMKSCGEWIKTRKESGQGIFPFCDDPKHDGRKSLAVTRCTAQRDSLALCNLVPFSKPLPQQFRNFDMIKGVKNEGLKYYGGSVELADFCPYTQEFEWKVTNASLRRDSRCELQGNNRQGEDILELYGSSSRCFAFEFPWTERKCGRTRALSHYMAGCYQHECINGTLFLSIFNASQIYPCYFEGQHVHVKRVSDGWLREGIILCPSCTTFCSQCNDPINTDEYIGDSHVDEPCSGYSIFYLHVFMISVILILGDIL